MTSDPINYRHEGRLAAWERTCARIRRTLAGDRVPPLVRCSVAAALEEYEGLLCDPERQRILGLATVTPEVP